MEEPKMGAGFVSGKEFEIGNITNEHTSDPIYWPVRETRGVYEHELEEMDKMESGES